MAEAENGEQGKNPGEEVTAPAGSDQGSGLAPRPIDSSISAIVGVGASAGGLEALEELFDPKNLLGRLMQDEDLMRQVLEAGGANGGEYGEDH